MPCGRAARDGVGCRAAGCPATFWNRRGRRAVRSAGRPLEARRSTLTEISHGGSHPRIARTRAWPPGRNDRSRDRRHRGQSRRRSSKPDRGWRTRKPCAPQARRSRPAASLKCWSGWRPCRKIRAPRRDGVLIVRPPSPGKSVRVTRRRPCLDAALRERSERTRGQPTSHARNGRNALGALLFLEQAAFPGG